MCYAYVAILLILNLSVSHSFIYASKFHINSLKRTHSSRHHISIFRKHALFGSGIGDRLKNITTSDNRPYSVVNSYKGVHKFGESWEARIFTKTGERKYLGTYKTELAAAKAYDRKAKQVWGRRLNFPHGDVNRKDILAFDALNRSDGKIESNKLIGITHNISSGDWYATIYVNGEMEHLGTYKTDVQAAKAYDKRALQFNESLNFPQGRKFKFKGARQRRNGKWESMIYLKGESQVYLGIFKTEIEAAKAYDKRAREFLNSKLNFPLNEDGSDTSPEYCEGDLPIISRNKYRGVRQLSSGKWEAKIFESGKQKHLGTFKTDLKAIYAFEKRAKQIGRLTNPGRFEEHNMLSPLSRNDPNRGGLKTSEKYINVRQVPSGNWESGIYVNGKRKYIGTFKTELQAARAHDVMARTIPNRRLNFPYDDVMNEEGKSREEDGKKEEKQEEIVIPKSLPGKKYKGFSLIKASGNYEASINVNGTKEYLGTFGSALLAAQAYDKRARTIPYRQLNFPDYDENGNEIVRKREREKKVFRELKKSKYKGVFQVPSGNWQTKIYINGNRHTLGTFPTEIKAAEVYDKAARKIGRQPNLSRAFRIMVESVDTENGQDGKKGTYPDDTDLFDANEYDDDGDDDGDYDDEDHYDYDCAQYYEEPFGKKQSGLGYLQ